MRNFAFVLVLSIAIGLGLTSSSSAVGPGGWDRLGTGATATAPALNGSVTAMNTDLPGQLIVGGKFTDAGGVAAADRIAIWNGSAWSAIGPSTFTGDVYAVETGGGRIFAGGTFNNAGGNPNADNLAVWDGVSWQPFCTSVPPGPAFTGNVTSIQAIGGTLYVGGQFLNGGGNSDADFLLACDLATGASSATTTIEAFPGPVYALTADSNGRLYAAGNFGDVESNNASDYVASYDGATWSNLGVGGGGGGLIQGIPRSITANGTDVYLGSDGNNLAGIPQADHIARWDGAAWHAVGANAAGTDGYLPSSGTVNGITTFGSQLYVTGNWLDAGGDPTADVIAGFDGTSWKPVGSNGAGNGPLPAAGGALAMFGGILHAGGNFTSAGGDPLAHFVAKYVPPFVLPSNSISIGPKPTFNKKKGTATLFVTVPGPGELVYIGEGIRRGEARAAPRATRSVTEAGTVKLTIKPDGKTKKKLKKKGKAKVTVEVTFTPTGGTPNTETKKLKLVKKK